MPDPLTVGAGSPTGGAKKAGGPQGAGGEGEGQDQQKIGEALVKAGLQMLQAGGQGGGGQQAGGGGGCPNCQGGGFEGVG